MISAGVGGTTDRAGSFWATLARRILRIPTANVPLSTAASPIHRLDPPRQLRFALGRQGGLTLLPAVAADDEVVVGRPLARAGDRGTLPSPVAGKVVEIASAPDLRGKASTSAVVIEVSDGNARPFAAMKASGAPREALLARLRDAGVLTASVEPRPLADLLEAGKSDTVIILAADREPGVTATTQLFRERRADVARAARLVGEAAGAGSVRVAVPAALASTLTGVQLLPLPAVYPETLEPAVARRAGAPGAVVVPLETALAALDAVETGAVQQYKVLTVIGFGGEMVGNYRVQIGTPLAQLLSEIGLAVEERDRVIAGGPLRGFAQYSLDAGIDAGIDAVTVMRAEALPPWSDAPCINCGACIDVCPAGLQVHAIGRYSEFALFERLPELRIDACFECGLCAMACTAHRPLLQLIRVGKRQIATDSNDARGAD